MFSDLRLAFRQLGKSPGFAAIAVLTLALGIGACTAIFSIINAALLRPLPYPEPDRVVEIWTRTSNGNLRRAITGPQFQELRDHSTTFEQVAVEHAVAYNLIDGAAAERVRGVEVSATYLDVLRVSPQVGHGFAADADKLGGENHVVILTHEFWSTRFGGDPSLVGRTINFNGTRYAVQGILPPGSMPRDTAQFLVPVVLEDDAWRMRPDNTWAPVVARLRPGVEHAAAQGETLALTNALQARLLTDRRWTDAALVRPLRDALLADSRPMLWVLFGAVGLVLLIACANVANLLLVRATSRQREMALRCALGASSARIVRQVLIESLVLSLLGGVTGVLLAAAGVDLAGRALVQHLPGMMQPTIDANVLVFSIALAGGTGVVFGLFPALRSRRTDLTRDLKESARGFSAGNRTRAQSMLVLTEVALTAALLVGAGLLLRSFGKLLDLDLGFNSRQVLVCDLSLAETNRNEVEARMQVHRELVRQLATIPGVEAVGTCSTLPFSGETWGGAIGLAEQPVSEHQLGTQLDHVGGRYFDAMGLSLVKGRFLTDDDNRVESPPVAVVTEMLARNLLADAEPIGRRVRIFDQVYEIVGVIRSTRHRDIEQDHGRRVYLPHVVDPHTVRLVLRTRVPPLSVVENVRRVVAQIDPTQSISNTRTLEQSVGGAMQQRRMLLVLVGIFATSALGLACLGIYGVMAYTINQRTRELGIRLALGASQPRLLRLVLRDGLRLTLLGVALGVVTAAAGARLISSLLFGVSTYDPVVFAGTPLLLAAVAFLACWLPARRTTRIDPIIALRAE